MAQQRRGGPRKGSGRPAEPLHRVRRNRVAVMLTDGELKRLEALAKRRDVPVSTAAHALLRDALREL